MLKKYSAIPILYLFVIFVFVNNSFGQDNMAPPKPLDNKVYDAMTGSWTGESDMMGMKMVQDVNIRWALNHQYIILDLTAAGKDNPQMKYNGMGIFGVDEKGNSKSWWFDDWGAAAMSPGSGTFVGDNKLDMTGGNAMFKEHRTFEITGNEMKMWAKGSMNVGGKDIPFEETTTFRKK